jgi:hypothetical protein
MKYQYKDQRPKTKPYPPNPIAVIPAGNAGIQLPWMANRKAAKKPQTKTNHKSCQSGLIFSNNVIGHNKQANLSTKQAKSSETTP